MKRSALDHRLRPLLESFASDLTDLITEAALAAVQRGLDGQEGLTSGPRGRPATIELGLAPRRHAASAPLSLDAYERMALRRALADSGGSALAAAKLLGMSKSAI